MDLACLSLAIVSFLTVVTAQSTISVSLSAQPTPGVSRVVNPSFAGFGIEPSNLFSFTGGSDENELTTNLLKNLADYTGVPPHIRVGGNTEDYMIYDDSMRDYVVKNNPNAVGQGVFASDSMIIGPRYFEAVDRFPQDTPITFGLNLAYEEDDYKDRITTMAEQALNRLKNVNLVSFEIGNEPDLYLQNQFRSDPQWGGRLYTEQWRARAGAIYQQVLAPRKIGSNFFEPGCTASTIGTSFQIHDLTEFDIQATANASKESYISQWNQHDYYYYIGVSTYPLTQDIFMDLSTTNTQFAAWEDQIAQADATGFPYALREMGVVGPIGLYAITDVFGAALWSLNFFFYAATLNITMVGMHMTDNSNASAWQPIEMYGNQPFVRPNYYSFAAFDQTIGPTCQARVGGGVIMGLTGDYEGRVAVYPVYQGGTLASVVLINSKPANISESNKESLTFELTLDSQFAGQDLYLALLTNDGADARHGTTFNGVSYEQSGDGTPTTVNSDQRTVTVSSDGTASIEVRDTEAVIVNIGTPLGQRKANQAACAKLAQTQPDAQPDPKGGSGTASNAASASSSNAASSTRSSTEPTSTNGVIRVSAMVFAALASTLFSGFVTLYV